MTIIVRDSRGNEEIADLENGLSIKTYFHDLSQALDKTMTALGDQTYKITVIMELEELVLHCSKSVGYPITIRRTSFLKVAYELTLDKEENGGMKV